MSDHYYMMSGVRYEGRNLLILRKGERRYSDMCVVKADSEKQAKEKLIAYLRSKTDKTGWKVYPKDVREIDDKNDIPLERKVDILTRKAFKLVE